MVRQKNTSCCHSLQCTPENFPSFSIGGTIVQVGGATNTKVVALSIAIFDKEKSIQLI